MLNCETDRNNQKQPVNERKRVGTASKEVETTSKQTEMGRNGWGKGGNDC